MRFQWLNAFSLLVFLPEIQHFSSTFDKSQIVCVYEIGNRDLSELGCCQLVLDVFAFV